MSSPSISVMNCGRAFSARLALAPVVIRRPMSCELLDHCERHALRLILDGLLLGPVRGLDASTQVLHGTIWDINMEGADRCGAPCRSLVTGMWHLATPPSLVVSSSGRAREDPGLLSGHPVPRMTGP